ncbi:MAG: acyltransferase [Acidobacteriota bacterium]|nr:acyltransferase [Acidobacteriota bacterium]
MGTISGDALALPAADTAGDEHVRGYRPELDAVRFLAFLLVFVHHFLLLSPTYATRENLVAFAGEGGWRVQLALAEACGMGLCLFFTLSAYLITSLLLDERRKYTAISVRRFYIRRALRIWPLYFLGVAIGLGFALASHQRNDVTGFVWYLLFAGNFYCGAFGWLHNPMTALWSISIEEQFYLLWPWAMRWISGRGLLACAFFFIAGANITLFIFGQHHVETDVVVWTNTFVQFEMFAVGILLALARKHMAWHKPGFGLMLAFTGPIFWFEACLTFRAKMPAGSGTATSGLSLMIAYALAALGCAAVLQGFCMIGPSHIPQWAANLGKISYGLYVYHILAIDFSHALFNSKHGFLPFAASVLVALLLTISAATVSYAYVETPFLRLKRRFELLHSRPI